MKKHTNICFVTSAILFCSMFWSQSVWAQNWSAIRGDDGVGVINPDGVLASSDKIELKTAWKKPIGSGYSSVVVAENRVIVMYTDEKANVNEINDVIACLDAKTGNQIWKKTIGPKFVGKNGSFDGPLSTPVIHKGNVFSLSATGRLLCFSMKDGAERWSRELQAEEGAPLPLYGFTTSPLVFDETLIVQIGAKEKSIAGFDINTGQTKWTAVDDSVASQSPTLISLSGQRVLLASGGKKLTGLDPSNGNIFFEYEHGGGNGSAVMPVLFDENKVLLTVDDSFSKAISLQPAEDNINVSEEWKERSIKNTYNIPAIHNGHAFAYSTRILTCVDQKDGKPKWKSRAPGDGFLIVVDGHMIINTKNGSLHVAKATETGYEEKAKLDLFQDLVWSIPAYSDNSIFVRSLGEVARVDIVASEKTGGDVASATMSLGPNFQTFVNQVNAATEPAAKQKLVDDFTTNHSSFPIVEGNIAHFIFRADTEDVALAGDFFGARQEKKMQRLTGTDVFYYGVELPENQRANYVFLTDYKPQLDPLNADRVVTSSVYAGEMEFAVRLRNEEPLKMNWLAMSNWNRPPFLDAISKDKPEIQSMEIEIEGSENKIKVDVLLPPGFDADSDRSYPVVYTLMGGQAQSLGKMPEIVTDIYQNQGKEGYTEVAPAIIVFLNNAGPEIASVVVPKIDSEFPTLATREGRSIIANGFVAGQGLSLALSNQDKFGAVSTQSPLMFAAAVEAMTPLMEKLEQPMTIYFEWGRFDMFNPHENWDIRSRGKEVYDELAKIDNISISGGEVNDSTDWASWRNRFDIVLKNLTTGD